MFEQRILQHQSKLIKRKVHQQQELGIHDITPTQPRVSLWKIIPCHPSTHKLKLNARQNELEEYEQPHLSIINYYRKRSLGLLQLHLARSDEAQKRYHEASEEGGGRGEALKFHR